MISPVIVAMTVHYFHLTGKNAVLLQIGAEILAYRCNILAMHMNI